MHFNCSWLLSCIFTVGGGKGSCFSCIITGMFLTFQISPLRCLYKTCRCANHQVSVKWRQTSILPLHFTWLWNYLVIFGTKFHTRWNNEECCGSCSAEERVVCWGLGREQQIRDNKEQQGRMVWSSQVQTSLIFVLKYFSLFASSPLWIAWVE